MVKYSVIIGKQKRVTKKGTKVHTYCLELEGVKDFEGQNTYRYTAFNPENEYEVGQRVLTILDDYGQDVTDLYCEE